MRIFAAALLLGVAAPLAAQQASTDTAAAPAAQGYAPATPPSTRTASTAPEARAGAIVLPTRPESELQEASSASQDELRRADARLVRAQASRSRSEALVEQRRLDMRQKEQDIEKAKKDKREADKRRLESEKKALERQKNWAEKLEAVDQAELDAAHQGSLTAFARQQSLNLEEQLFKARAGSGSDKLSKQSSDLLIQQLELQTLEAQQKYRKLAHELARQEEALAGQRLDLYKAARQ